MSLKDAAVALDSVAKLVARAADPIDPQGSIALPFNTSGMYRGTSIQTASCRGDLQIDLVIVKSLHR